MSKKRLEAALEDAKPDEEISSFENYWESKIDYPFSVHYTPKLQVFKSAVTNYADSIDFEEVSAGATDEVITITENANFHPQLGMVLVTDTPSKERYYVHAVNISSLGGRGSGPIKQALQDHDYFLKKMCMLMDLMKADDRYYGVGTVGSASGLSRNLTSKKVTDAILKRAVNERDMQKRIESVTPITSSVTQDIDAMRRYVNLNTTFPMTGNMSYVYSYVKDIYVHLDLQISGIHNKKYKQGLQAIATVTSIQLQKVPSYLKYKQSEDNEEAEEDDESGEPPAKKARIETVTDAAVLTELQNKFLNKVLLVNLISIYGEVEDEKHIAMCDYRYVHYLMNRND
jgi:hypothetical protein